MADKAELEALKDSALLMRKQIIELCYHCGPIHLGGDLSSTDLLTVLFQHTLNIRPEDPTWEGRDRVIMSKGHGSAALYLAMANRGYFDPQEPITTFGKNGTRFGGHPCRRECPMLDASSGSLGHGMPIGVGIALAAKLNHDTHRTFVILGDGELGEGSNWEAMMAAHQYKLGNLVAIVDRNRLSLDGFTEELMALDPLDDKWRAFGWNVKVIDGNSIEALVETFDNLPASDSDVPTVIIAETVKGKGVKRMENKPIFHSGTINAEQMAEAFAELDAARAAEKEAEEC